MHMRVHRRLDWFFPQASRESTQQSHQDVSGEAEEDYTFQGVFQDDEYRYQDDDEGQRIEGFSALEA